MEYTGYKLFEKKDFANQFIEGKIYISAVGNYINDTNQQRQYNETIIPTYNQSLFINGNEYKIPYRFTYEELKRIPVFCCTSLDKNNGKHIDGSYHFEFDKETESLGKYMVLFDIRELFSRLASIVTKNGIGLVGKKVKYFDFENIKDDSWLKMFKDEYDFLYIHDAKHKSQNEFRIVFKYKFFSIGCNNTVIDIGKWETKPMLIEL